MSAVEQIRCSDAHRPSLVHLTARIYGEFREMPGLTLSVAQAARLFSVDRVEIQALLEALVDAQLLQTDGRIYALAGSGRLCA